MSLLCEVLTEEPEGGSGIIPVDTFMKLYKYLAALDCGPDPTPPKTSGDGIHSDTLEYSEAKPGEESEVWDTLLSKFLVNNLSYHHETSISNELPNNIILFLKSTKLF